MNRLVLRQLLKVRFASEKTLSQTTGRKDQIKSLSIPQGFQDTIQKTRLTQHQLFLQKAHQNLALNFAEEVDGRIPLIVASPQQNSLILPTITGASLSVLALYQLLAGSYTYVCALGTLGLGAFVFAKYAGRTLLTSYKTIRNVNLLNDGNLQVFYSYGGSQIQKTPLVINKKDFKFGASTKQYLGQFDGNVTINGQNYLLPSQRVINQIKIKELLDA